MSICVPEPSADPVMIRAYHGEHKGATAFFRNRPFLQTLTQLLAGVCRQRCRILVHACSVGAEPYSLAMWWVNHVRPQSPLDIEILATDIDAEFLQFAGRGEYPASLLAGMTPREQGWFERSGENIRVPDEARRLVRFLEPRSFVDEGPGEEFDAVMVMNALTYVSPAEQQLALRRMASCARHALGLTAFHPDTIRADIEGSGFEPWMENHRQIHEAWGDRLAKGPVMPGTPEYSWRLPPYSAETPDYAYRFGAIFVRARRGE